MARCCVAKFLFRVVGRWIAIRDTLMIRNARLLHYRSSPDLCQAVPDCCIESPVLIVSRRSCSISTPLASGASALFSRSRPYRRTRTGTQRRQRGISTRRRKRIGDDAAGKLVSGQKPAGFRWIDTGDRHQGASGQDSLHIPRRPSGSTAAPTRKGGAGRVVPNLQWPHPQDSSHRRINRPRCEVAGAWRFGALASRPAAASHHRRRPLRRLSL